MTRKNFWLDLAGLAWTDYAMIRLELDSAYAELFRH